MIDIPDVKIMMVYEQPGNFVTLSLTALLGENRIPVGQLAVRIEAETLDRLIDDLIIYRDAIQAGIIAKLET